MMPGSSLTESCGEVSVLLGELKRGRKGALDELIPLVYRELRRVAGHYEVFLRLVDQNHANWQNRAQFIGVASQFMRRLLVDPVGALSNAASPSP